jgi:hypothetical protein
MRRRAAGLAAMISLLRKIQVALRAPLCPLALDSLRGLGAEFRRCSLGIITVPRCTRCFSEIARRLLAPRKMLI